MDYAGLKATVGLYITKATVTVAQVKPTVRGPQLIKSAQVKVESEQLKREELVKVINKAFAKAGIESKKVVSGLSGIDVMIRFFRMPVVSKEEQKSAARFEAKKYIPFRIEDVTSASWIIEKRGEPNMEVIFAACKKEYIDDHLSLLKAAGLTPKALEPASIGLLRVLYSSGQIKKMETIAVVNANLSNTEMTIVRNGIPYLSRELTLNVSDTKSFIDNLLGEMQLSFDYYRRQFPGDSISKIILYAEEKLKEADESLSKELSIPVVRANPLEGLDKGQRSSSVELSIASGLALRGLIKPQVEIELYVDKDKSPQERKKLIKAAVITSLPAILILIALYLFMSNGVTKLKAELNKAKEARIKTDLISFDMSPTEMKRLKAKIGKKLIIFKKLMDDRIYWTAKFDELAKILPEGVWFEEVKFQERVSKGMKKIQRSFTLKVKAFLGDAGSELELVNKFLSDLKNNKKFFEGFQEAELTFVNRGEDKGFQITKFEILCYTRK